MEESDMLFPFFEPDEPPSESTRVSDPSDSKESGVSSPLRGKQEEEQDSTTREVNFF
jgi:hypothetical protein